MNKPKRRFPRWLIVTGVIAALLACAALAARPLVAGLAGGQGLPGRPGQPGALKTGQVTSITAVTSVESSGSIQPLQSASVFWETNGTVAAVNVKPGGAVKAGDVLMTLDPASAPANVIAAQADLISAQKALNDLLHPSALAIANAQKAVADAQDALESAQRRLRNLSHPNVAYYQEQVDRAQDALIVAQNDQSMTDLAISLRGAQDAAEAAKNRLEDLQELEAAYPGCCTSRLEDAQEAYDRALEDLQNAALRFEQSQIQNANAVEDAQKKLDEAQRNLAAALASPNPTDQAQAEAEVAVAEANLADAQRKLDQLLNGADPDDVAAAQARVLAAQATVESLTIKAPFDGEVLVVNYRPGDSTSASLAAVILANRRQLHVDAAVDETQISQVQVGDAVTVTFDSLSGLALPAVVDWINPVGSAVQGLVKYTVRVNLSENDPRVLLGMTANVTIVTDVQAGALAVPLDAVQLDGQGEFVNRVRPDGSVERVNVVSGQLQGELVIVTGDLRAGDTVQIVEPVPTNSGNPFGPG
jgi:HlyD family secretion protein